jgi:hypothetical protein
MTNAKHTTGPWGYETFTDEQGDTLFEIEIWGENGEAICRVDFEGVGNTSNAWADARLMVAASAMHEALKAVFADGSRVRNAVFDKVCAALSLAEGTSCEKKSEAHTPGAEA